MKDVSVADISEIRALLARYLTYGDAEIILAQRVDPDAVIFELKVDGVLFFLLEEDYIADLEEVINRFSMYGLKNPQLQELVSPPKAFDYEASLMQDQIYSIEGDDYNRLRLYETIMEPKRLNYTMLYYLAKESEA